MPIALTILLFVIGAALIGGATVIGSPIFGVVIALFVLAALGAVSVLRRTAGRDELVDSHEEIEFTERDRKTLLPTPDAEEKAQLRRRAEERERR